jgi:hypothetical protein
MARTLNTELVDEISEHIKPTNFDMRSWSYERDGRFGEPCGTTCCIAGWARVLTSSQPKRTAKTIRDSLRNDPVAAKLLGIPALFDEDDDDYYTPLFYMDVWPSKYIPSTDWLTNVQRSAVEARAARRLLRDIKRGEVKLTSVDRQTLSEAQFKWWAQFSKSRVAQGVMLDA